MRKKRRLPSQVAHSSYLRWFEKKTELKLIIYQVCNGKNRILTEIGWAGVAVDGFIPPNALWNFRRTTF
jgi:phenylalanine-4-hydroxylase